MNRWFACGVFATICIVSCFSVASAELESFSHSQSTRIKRYTKDPVPNKDGIFPAKEDKKVKALTTRLEALESKVEDMNDKEDNVLKTLEEGFKNASIREDLLQEQIKDLSEKVNDLEGTVSTDGSYYTYHTECGGVITSQTGRIVYTDPYRPGPLHSKTSCIWTIRANHRSKINVHLTSLSHVLVTELLIAKDGTHTVNHTKIVNTHLYVLNGPVIFLTSLSRSIGLTFAGHGKKVHQHTIFHHLYFNQSQQHAVRYPKGTVLPTKGMERSFSTTVVRIDPSNLLELDIALSGSGCANASFHIQTGDGDFDGPNAQVKNNSACCSGSTSSCNLKRYTLDGWFALTYSSLLPNPNELSVAWKPRTNQSDSIDRCGGVLMGKGGKISYKKLSPYMNNERCVWAIYPFPKSSIKLLQFSGGFESTYDRVIIFEVDREEGSTGTELSSSLYTSRNFTGRVILVAFITDASVVRNGFELTWEATGPSDFRRSLEHEKIMHNSLKHVKFNNMALTNPGFALQVVTSGEMDGSSLDLTVERKQFFHCQSSRLKIFGIMEGDLMTTSSIINPCTTSTTPLWNMSSPDGIGMVLLDNPDAQGKVEMNVSWNFVTPDTSIATEVAQDKCGGVIRKSTGRLNYKLESNYDNLERCIWLIYSPSSSGIKLRLSKEGFEKCCDYILVNTIDPNTGLMNNFTGVLTRDNNTGIFPGNLVIVTFRSDGSVNGKGFALDYTGQGQAQSTAPKYKLLHLEEVTGSYHYERNQSGLNGWGDDDGSDLGENDIVVIAYSTESGDGSSVTIFNASVSDTIFGVDDNCKSDALNFYTTPSREGFSLGETYPKLKCTPTSTSCGNCVGNKLVGNDTTPDAFSSGFRAFVGIYKPVLSSSINNQGFSVHWDSSSGCGGVQHEVEGRIFYKLNSRYKNLEQCIWTVNIPIADKIRFTLLNNGFEPCCDMIILSSLDPKTGSIASSMLLKSDQSIVVMNGPVVFVTFRSDGSVTGEGFSLKYSGIPLPGTTTVRSLDSYLTSRHPGYLSTDDSIDYVTDYNYDDTGTTIRTPTPLSSSTSLPSTTPLPSPPPSPTFNYYHFHVHRRNSSFTYPSSNPFLRGGRRALGPNDIITITFSPEPIRNESFVSTGTSVSIKTLDLKVNNETCVSDSFRFYEAFSSGGFNASKSYSVPVPDKSNCESILDSQWACDNCLANQTVADQNKGVVTYSPAFIAIYKSATVGVNKTFTIEWRDFSRFGIVPPATASTIIRRS